MTTSKFSSNGGLQFANSGVEIQQQITSGLEKPVELGIAGQLVGGVRIVLDRRTVELDCAVLTPVIAQVVDSNLIAVRAGPFGHDDRQCREVAAVQRLAANQYVVAFAATKRVIPGPPSNVTGKLMRPATSLSAPFPP